jgi:hypothetical protein
MAHYAFLDENNIVTEVITGVNETEFIEGLDPEIWYGNFRGQVCKRTSYNTYHNAHKNNGTAFRGNYAGIGYKYDQDFNVFIPPQPYPSWKLDYTIYDWVSPVPKPEDTEEYWWKWSEINKEWVSIPIE